MHALFLQKERDKNENATSSVENILTMIWQKQNEKQRKSNAEKKLKTKQK